MKLNNYEKTYLLLYLLEVYHTFRMQIITLYSRPNVKIYKY